MHSLAFERLLASNVAPLRVRMNALLENARKQKKLHAELRARILDLELRTRAAGHLQAIALNLVERGDSKMSAWVSALKLATSQLRQQIADTAVLIDGGRCVTSGPLGIGAADPQSDISARWAYEVLEARSATIYAGTSEIQRNIISEVGLGLPR
jgi:alkylation response protein AidB-like acyl-CoA dehydrogenase